MIVCGRLFRNLENVVAKALVFINVCISLSLLGRQMWIVVRRNILKTEVVQVMVNVTDRESVLTGNRNDVIGLKVNVS